MESLLPEALISRAWAQANFAQVEAVCDERLPLCLLTDTAARAALQPFVYLEGPRTRASPDPSRIDTKVQWNAQRTSGEMTPPGQEELP